MTELLYCPHCSGGKLHKTQDWQDYDYDCNKCGRGWRVDTEGTWHALFDAGMNKYTADEVKECQDYWKRRR